MTPKKVSIDIRAESHNPTILNPDFLKYNQIVNSDWVLAGPPICTPPFAMVKFAQGVSIFAQSENIVFEQEFDDLNKDVGILVPEIAHRYVQKLPFVNYNEVNTTFGSMLWMSERESKFFVTDRFLKDGVWNNNLGSTKAEARLRLMYSESDQNDDDSILVDIAAETVEQSSGDRKFGINFEFTFHRHVSEGTHETKLKVIEATLTNWERDFEKSVTIWNQLTT